MKINKRLFLTVGIILCLSFPAYAYEKCMMCGMDAHKSETKIVVMLSKGTPEVTAGQYSFCCLRCMLAFKDKLKGGKIETVLVRDYATVTTKYDSGQMFAAEKGLYLVESNVLPRGSMTPFMLVFSEKEEAENFQKNYGGRILNWDQVVDYVRVK